MLAAYLHAASATSPSTTWSISPKDKASGDLISRPEMQEDNRTVRTLARERDKAEILARMANVRPDSVRRWGRMSPQQMVCHLGDWSRMLLVRKAVSPTTSLLRRTAIKWLALYGPLPWPQGLETSAELDQEHGGTPPGDFAADLAEACALLETVAASAGRLAEQPHPFFGAMSQRDWLRMAYLHSDHHLRQFGL